MPGGGHRFEWTGEVPWYLRILFLITFAEFVVGWILKMTISKWAQTIPDAAHPVELKMKFGHFYYLSPRLVWFMNNDLWIFFGLLGILFLTMFLHKNRVRRVV